MPVWHEAIRKWVAEGKLAVLGITQEQHPDRCRLFAQWKQFDWPIAWDPINSLESAAVPILVAIDEHGVVRSTRPRLEAFEKEFLNVAYGDDGDDGGPVAPAAENSGPSAPKPDLSALASRAEDAPSARAFRDWADACVLWGGAEKVDTAIAAYERALELGWDDANTHFRLGVAYRLRYDSPRREPADFQHAVRWWEQALAGNPNQYIWRRRLQQYGPRLDKPYSFYDWVDQARREIGLRGEKPVALGVDPHGAELALPVRDFAVEPLSEQSPYPGGEIARDAQELIQADMAIVPSRIRPGGAARVHIALAPHAKSAHWNNEAEPLVVWVEAPVGWRVSQQAHRVAGPDRQATSTEIRRVDFEVQAPADAAGVVELPVYALYHVCKDGNGECLYRRQDWLVTVVVAPETGAKRKQ